MGCAQVKVRFRVAHHWENDPDHRQVRPSAGGMLPPCNLREELCAYGASERVGVPVHEPPTATVSAEHQGEPQRPLLAGQVTDSAMLLLGGHQDREVPRQVRSKHLELCVSPAEGPRRPVDSLVRRVEALPGSPPFGGMSV